MTLPPIPPPPSRWQRHGQKVQGRKAWRHAVLPPAADWFRRAGRELGGIAAALRDGFGRATPLGQLRQLLNLLLLVCGCLLVLILIVPGYDRALLLAGRTEVASVVLDDAAFGNLVFSRATLRADPDLPANLGRLALEIRPGTTLRFVRSGRGALRVSFTDNGSGPATTGCRLGAHAVGTVTINDAPAAPLCDVSVVVVPFSEHDDPMVISLSGAITIGEEVSQGVGPRPMLLDAEASLLVRHHSWVFRTICAADSFHYLCDRFVANTTVLSAGDAVRASGRAGARAGGGIGFIRIDPAEFQSGMRFDLAAPATAFEVQRLKGETYDIRETLFEVIEKSPVIHMLNGVIVVLGLAWWFIRLPKSVRDGGAPGAQAVLLCVLLGTAAPARADQALLKANDLVGQALLRARADRCYAVTPRHVLGEEHQATLVAPGRLLGEAQLIGVIPAAPEAVALLTVKGVPLSECPAFEGAPNLDAMLHARAAATLRQVVQSGAVYRLALVVTAVEVETLEVETTGPTLAEGMSGSTVLVGDQPVGLLVDVTNDGHTGRVARLDRIFERLAPHLGAVPPPEALPVAAAGRAAFEVVRWTAEPVAAVNGPGALNGTAPGPWRVAAGGPAELVFRIAGHAVIGGIAVDVSGLADPPHAVEVFGGRSERGPWQSLATMALEPGDGVREVPLRPPVPLPFMMLRATAPAGARTQAMRNVEFGQR